MVKSKKEVGYYISKGRCLKEYVKYDLKKKKYSKKRYNSKNKELKKVKVYKKKSDCKKKIMKLKKEKERKKVKKVKKQVKKQAKKIKKVIKKNKNRFGDSSGEMCTNYAPYFGSLVPVISPHVSGTAGTGYSSGSALWPEGFAKQLQSQSYRQLK